MAKSRFKKGTPPTQGATDGSRWIRAKLLTDVFPSSAACYVIFEGRKLLYIGSAVNLRSRLCGHRIYEGLIGYREGACDPKKVTVAYRPSLRVGDWAMVEIRLIRRLKPPLNRAPRVATCR